MSLPKFILTMDGRLRLGMVSLHSELVNQGEDCIGGGLYDLDYLSWCLILYRQSHDYGCPRWHLVDTLHVPEAYRGWRIRYVFDDGYHEDFPVSEKLPIEYY